METFRSKIHDMFEEMADIGQPVSRRGVTISDDAAADRNAMQRRRAGLVQQLGELRTSLLEQHTEREAYQLLFPIVVFLDEAVLVGYPGLDSPAWPLLQREFFDTDSGGELFYEALDDILDQSLPPLVYETFLFCLKLGFRGRFSGNEARIAGYKKRLAAKFPAPDLAPAAEHAEETGQLKTISSGWWFYGAAAATVALGYWGLLLFG